MNGSRSPREVYADIIDLPHHQAESRSHMSLHDRAAQFAPFATLAGFDSMVREEARITDTEVSLSESAIELINQKLTLISEKMADGDHPYITLTCFRPDGRKAGGSYGSVSGYVKKIDPLTGKVTLFRSNDLSGKKAGPIEIDMNKIKDILWDEAYDPW